MEVRAIKEGYHNHRYRKVGEVFNLEPVVGLYDDPKDGKRKQKTFSVDQQFADFWMEKLVDDEPAPRKKVAAKKVERPSEDVI